MITTQQFNEWLKRLRSGKYQQGNGMLKQLLNADTDEVLPEPRYCCLGVLAGILCEAGILEENADDTFASFYLTHDQDSETDALLPASIITSDTQMAYAEANDNGMPFRKIADLIARDVRTGKLAVKD